MAFAFLIMLTVCAFVLAFGLRVLDKKYLRNPHRPRPPQTSTPFDQVLKEAENKPRKHPPADSTSS
jgi:hypothetical protein